MNNNLWSKYLYTPLYLFLIFISACSSPNPVPQENKYQEETFQENQENQAKKLRSRNQRSRHLLSLIRLKQKQMSLN